MEDECEEKPEPVLLGREADDNNRYLAQLRFIMHFCVFMTIKLDNCVRAPLHFREM